MSKQERHKKSSSNKKVSSKNKDLKKDKRKKRRAAIARIKAQVDARKKAEEKALQEQEEWDEEQDRFEEERIAEEEKEKKRKRQEKELKAAQRADNKKQQMKNQKDRKERLLMKRLKKYNIDPETKMYRTKPFPEKDPNTLDSSSSSADWENYSNDDNSDTFENSKDLRSPIICFLGHVDVGKTKLLDYLRQTNVQDNEAGGITQQIGSTYFPIDKIKETIDRVAPKKKMEYNIPGFLIIDTPGHESFINLRSRGSGICDFVILVVDLLKGLEKQTIESIELLKLRKTPFVIALNKLDLVYGWNNNPGESSARGYKKQTKDIQQRIDSLVNRILIQMAEQGLNAQLYWKNFDPKGTISMIPLSAHTGEGVPDLLIMISLMIQRFLSTKVSYSNEFKATVLEVKPIKGLGTTLDVILVNGVINRGDRIVVCGINGPIVTTVRDLLTTQPMKELRIKSPYLHYDSIRAAQGVKILANDLEQAVAGSSVYVVHNISEQEEGYNNVMEEYDNLKTGLNRDGIGVYVQASTMGGLEALLHFLRKSDVPVVGFGIGPVTKTDVIKASVMYTRGISQYSVILAFDVPISADIRTEADKSHVRIFEADIIYHLLDSFNNYVRSIEEANRETASQDAITPCILEILPNCIFNNRNPIIIGVLVKEGELRIGTPLCVTGKNTLELGSVTKIELNHRERDIAREGEEVAISIEGPNNYCYGRQFDHTQKLYSKLSRLSIDSLKEFFRDTLTPVRVRLIIKIKKKLGLE